MPLSGDTVLRLIRQRGIGPYPPPRVVGIDDWAWRRGRRYGTIVCDLERRRVIDLLPGRASAPVRDWLAAHPSVTVVSHDRSGPYAEAARTGAPAATQVADRWHLLVNASEALRAVVERHHPQIRDAARQCAPVRVSSTPAIPGEDAPTAERGGPRRERCEAALRLRGEGLSTKDIVRRTGASRNAVRRWVRAGRFVSYRRAPDPSRLDRHLPVVEARWREGERNAAALHRELRGLGFDGGYDIVRRWATRRRTAPIRPPPVRIPSTRRITRWLTSDPAALCHEERRFAEALCASAPKLGLAAAHVRAFADLLRQGVKRREEPGRWRHANPDTPIMLMLRPEPVRCSR